MCKVLLPLFASLALMYPSSAPAQIRIGTVELTLRSSKASTLERLRSDFAVDSIKPSDDIWMVHSRPGLPLVVWGTVRFDAGRLGMISRVWDPSVSETSQADALRASIGALQSLLVGRQANCRIVDRSSHSPGYEATDVQVFCGLHSVNLSVSRIEGKEKISITEFLGAEKGTPPD